MSYVVLAATTAVQVMGHMAVPRVLKNTNVRGATQEAPLTGERERERERQPRRQRSVNRSIKTE